MALRRPLIRPFALITLGVISLTGCAGSQLNLGKAFDRRPTAETVETRPAPRDVDLDENDERAGRPSPFVDPAEVGRNVQQVSGTDAMQRIDPATWTMIEQEFRDASLAEKQKWYEILSNVEPAMIPQMLSIRRAMATRDEPSADPLADAFAFDDPRPPYSSNSDTRTSRREPPGPTIVKPAAQQEFSSNPRTYGDLNIVPGKPQRRPDFVWPQETDEPAANVPASTPTTAKRDPTRADADTRMTDSSERTTSRPAWPPRDDVNEPNPSGSTRNAGHVEMPDFPEQQRVTPTAAVTGPDGRYALSNDWDTQLHRVIDIIEDDLAGRAAPTTEDETAEYTRLHAYLRMLYMMDGQQTRSLQAIPDLKPTHQEFWTQLFWGLNNYFDDEGIPDPGHRATETITQLRSAVEKLKPESRLQLRNATFCHKINSFGNYERFDRDEFEPGQAVLVYSEVQNFASEIDSEGFYETRLRSTIEIHRAGRGPESGLVHERDYAATRDTCRNLRQDYFHSYRLDLPSTLTPGPYTLKLLVEDELSHRIASTSLSFVVR